MVSSWVLTPRFVSAAYSVLFSCTCSSLRSVSRTPLSCSDAADQVIKSRDIIITGATRGRLNTYCIVSSVCSSSVDFPSSLCFAIAPRKRRKAKIDEMVAMSYAAGGRFWGHRSSLSTCACHISPGATPLSLHPPSPVPQGPSDVVFFYSSPIVPSVFPPFPTTSLSPFRPFTVPAT